MKIDKISMETRLLARENISTIEQLFSYKNSIEKEIDSLVGIRESLRRNVRKNVDETKISKIKDEISDSTRKIRELRKKITLCDGIAERSKVIDDRLKQIQKDEEKERMKGGKAR